jgi:hypothetical protein
MKKSYHEFCAVDDPYLHYHRLADDEPAAGVDAPLTATPVVWITLLQLISAEVFASEVSQEPYKKYWLHIRLLRFPAGVG